MNASKSGCGGRRQFGAAIDVTGAFRTSQEILDTAFQVKAVSESKGLLRIRRLGKNIALDLLTTHSGKNCDFFWRFRPFGHDRHAEALPESDHSGQKLSFTLRLGDAVDKNSINLKLAERHLCQVSERRIAGTKIVQRQFYAKPLQ